MLLKGTKVRARSDHTVHPQVRARMGEVVGSGPSGCASVQFEGINHPIYVEEAHLDVVPPPPPPTPEPSPPGD